MAKRKVVPKKKPVAVNSDLVFIPIVYGAYRANKINLLNAEIKVLECIKTINSIRELQKQKDVLKLKFYRNLSEALRLYYQLKNFMPQVSNHGIVDKMRKSVEIAVNYTDSNSSFSYSKKITQTDELDVELREIQAKLNALNSSKNLN